MRRVVWIFAVFLAGGAAALAEPRNLDLHKNEIRAYVDTGEYGRDLSAVGKNAEAWLSERAGKRAVGERLALVLDLDETLLSNWPFMAAEDLGGSDARWDQWLARGEATAIEPVREVYLAAGRLRIDVFFVTGRREHLRAATQKNLATIGCADCAALIMKPEDWHGKTAAFKTAERERLARDGRAIVANLGDQESDLSGGFSERTFKLPGPFYLSE
jgi:predicted secreted acid phosphatase